ncbi:MAG: helix-turn-helix domain-containing protein [Mycobacterium sp.]
MSRESTSLAVVVGENCRRIRVDAGVTQNALAKHACDAGLCWTASKVGQFERGQYNPAFSTVLAVTYALS